ncbi:MAG: hypothetical protein ACLQU3_23660 [Limisphaerales bacterium]|jgi:hypothetical protein
MTVAGQIKKGAYFDSVTLVRYDDAKGYCMGLCFTGQPESYGFRTTGAEKK